MKTSTIIWVIVVVLVVAGLGWWWVGQTPAAQAPAQNGAAASGSDQNMPDTGVVANPTSVTVTYDGANFSPASVTVPVGGTIHWVDTSGQMWVASNPHPVHTGYDGTDRTTHCAAGYSGAAPFDQCASGSTFSFTFTKAGSFGYHDHLNHSAAGNVTVQ